jgi:hypothetical protein
LAQTLSRAVSSLRGKIHVRSLMEAKALIKKEQDVKDIFWGKVSEFGYKIKDTNREALLSLIDYEN